MNSPFGGSKPDGLTSQPKVKFCSMDSPEVRNAFPPLGVPFTNNPEKDALQTTLFEPNDAGGPSTASPSQVKPKKLSKHESRAVDKSGSTAEILERLSKNVQDLIDRTDALLKKVPSRAEGIPLELTGPWGTFRCSCRSYDDSDSTKLVVQFDPDGAYPDLIFPSEGNEKLTFKFTKPDGSVATYVCRYFGVYWDMVVSGTSCRLMLCMR